MALLYKHFIPCILYRVLLLTVLKARGFDCNVPIVAESKGLDKVDLIGGRNLYQHTGKDRGTERLACSG